MSCATTADHSLVVPPVPTRVPLRWRGFIKTIVAIHDAFLEALEMQRAAHKRHRLNDE
jgi:hypothetical protein